MLIRSHFGADTKKPLPLYPAIDGCDCEYCRWRRAQKKKRKKEPAIIGHLFAALNRDIHDAERARDPLRMMNGAMAQAELLHLIGKLK